MAILIYYALRVNLVGVGLLMKLLLLVASFFVVYYSYAVDVKIVFLMVAVYLVLALFPGMLNANVYLYFFVIFYLVYVFGFYFILEDTYLGSQLSIRISQFVKFFDSFGVADIFFPVANSYRLVANGSMHSELIEVFSFYGFVGVFVYYYNFIKPIFYVNKYDSQVAIFLLVTISLLALVVLPSLHFYSGLAFSFMIMFYKNVVFITVHNKYAV